MAEQIVTLTGSTALAAENAALRARIRELEWLWELAKPNLDLLIAAQNRVAELEAKQGYCQIHGECPVCRANRIAGDIRISVASTFDREAK